MIVSRDWAETLVLSRPWLWYVFEKVRCSSPVVFVVLFRATSDYIHWCCIQRSRSIPSSCIVLPSVFIDTTLSNILFSPHRCRSAAGIVAKQSRTIASGWQMSGAVAGPLFAKSFLLNSTHHPFNPTRPSNAPSSICATASPPLIAIVETFSDASALSFSTLLLRQIFLILRFQDGGRAGSRADPTCC